jgi:hypothetical protein
MTSIHRQPTSLYTYVLERIGVTNRHCIFFLIPIQPILFSVDF